MTTRTILLHEMTSISSSEINAGLHLLRDTLEKSRGVPDRGGPDWCLWRDRDLRIHVRTPNPGTATSTLLVGSESMALAAAQKRMPGTKLARVDDMNGHWTIDSDQTPSRPGTASRLTTAVVIRTILERMIVILEEAQERGIAKTGNPLSAFAEKLLPAFADRLLRISDEEWNIHMLFTGRGAVAACETRMLPFPRKTSLLLPREVLPEDVTAMGEPISLSVKSGSKSIWSRMWTSQATISRANIDPVSLMRSLRDPSISSCVETIMNKTDPS